VLSNYIKKVFETGKHGDAREESYYPALNSLLETFAKESGHARVQVTSQPKKTEAGNPDFRVWDGKQHIVGYLEAKPPTKENLARAVAALRSADRRMANPSAPCLLEDTVRMQTDLDKEFEALHKAWLARDLAAIVAISEKHQPGDELFGTSRKALRDGEKVACGPDRPSPGGRESGTGSPSRRAARRFRPRR